MSLFRKLSLILVLLAGAVACYALAGFYGLPYLLQRQLPAWLAAQYGPSLQLRDARFDPFQGILMLEGVSLAPAEGKPVLAFERLLVDADVWTSLRQRGAVLERVILEQPEAEIIRRAGGEFNVSELLPPSETPPEAVPAEQVELPFSIDRLEIRQGRLAWEDQSIERPQHETLSNIEVTVEALSNRDDGKALLDIGLQLASGGRLQWKGDWQPMARLSQGQLKLEALDLVDIWQEFLQDLLPVEIADGRLSVQGDYRAAYDDGQLDLTVDHGRLAVDSLNVVAKDGGAPLLAMPVLAMSGISFDWNKKRLDIVALSSDRASITAYLQADGRLNYQALFASGEAQEPAADADVKPAWKIGLQTLALNDYRISFTDYTQPKPVEWQLNGLALTLQNFSNQVGSKLALQLTSGLNRSGRVNVTGDLVFEPLSGNLQVGLENIDLKRLQTYLDRYLNLELVNGDFTSHGALQLAQADAFWLKFQGDANLAGLITRDKAKNKDFVKWSDLQLQQIDVDWAKQAFNVGRVVWEQPYLRFTIKKDKSTNIQDIFLAGQTKSDAKPVQTEDPKPQFGIGKIAFKDGKADFADYSLILPFVAEMNALNGEVDGFSSQQAASAQLALKGKVYDLAQVDIKGRYQLQSGDSDISLNFSHMPLPLITPYMAEFAGYRIEKGQMALDLQYTIKKGLLEAHNKVFIDQLVLGEHVENPKAVSLPLHLAVALLKDADGKIDLDFPITGSLEDPQFSVGSLLSDVLVNLVEKVVLSPFHALSSLLNDEQDFSTVSFAAGSAELSPQEAVKLDELGRALQRRPGLVLEIKGMAYQQQDWPVMRFDAVVDILKKMKSGELRDQGQRIRSEYIELSDDEYKRLLAKFFKEVFPLDIDYSLLGKPRIKAEPGADFYELARQKLEAKMQPEPQRLNDLAVARANAIAKYLSEKAAIDRSRVYILAPDLDSSGSNGIVSVLSLNAVP